MPRKKLKLADVKTELIQFRVTRAELKMIRAKVKMAGIPRAEFFRRLALHYEAQNLSSLPLK